MNKRVILLLMGLVFLSSCTTHYEVVLTAFNMANDADRTGHKGRSMKEYDNALLALRKAPEEGDYKLLQAMVHYQIYLTEPAITWPLLDKGAQERAPLIGQIIADQAVGKSPDFLTLAFQSVRASEEQLKETRLSEQEEWLLIGKDLIIGAMLAREASRPEDETIMKRISDVVPNEFVSDMRRYALYESAAMFYLDAWAKAIIFNYRLPAVKTGWLTELAQKQLQEVCLSLANLATTLSYRERRPEFTEVFQNKSRQYLEAIRQMGRISFPLPPEMFSSEEKVAALIGLAREGDYLSLDGAYHLKEARVKMSQAIEGMLAKKGTLTVYFLDTLKHLVLARMPGNLVTSSDQQLANSLEEDSYINLSRSSE